jgi:hypothetical protein
MINIFAYIFESTTLVFSLMFEDLRINNVLCFIIKNGILCVLANVCNSVNANLQRSSTYRNCYAVLLCFFKKWFEINFSNISCHVVFEFLMAMHVRCVIFWVVMPSSSEMVSLTLKVEVICSSKMTGSPWTTCTYCFNPEDHILHKLLCFHPLLL